MGALSEVEQHGFVILPEVLSPPEAQRLIDDLDQSALRRSIAGVRHALRDPAVASLAQVPRLLDVAQEIPGNGVTVFRLREALPSAVIQELTREMRQFESYPMPGRRSQPTLTPRPKRRPTGDWKRCE
jgi:hypothetical protein